VDRLALHPARAHSRATSFLESRRQESTCSRRLAATSRTRLSHSASLWKPNDVRADIQARRCVPGAFARAHAYAYVRSGAKADRSVFSIGRNKRVHRSTRYTRAPTSASRMHGVRVRREPDANPTCESHFLRAGIAMTEIRSREMLD